MLDPDAVADQQCPRRLTQFAAQGHWETRNREETMTGTTHPQWRIRGVRLWIPALLLVCFLGSAILRLAFQGADPWRTRDVAQLVFNLVGAAAVLVLVLTTSRTRVSLGTTGIEVRAGRRKHVPYDAVARVYRDRFTSGAVTLLLHDGTKVVLPAPVAGLGVSSTELDDAVRQIRGRLSA